MGAVRIHGDRDVPMRSTLGRSGFKRAFSFQTVMEMDGETLQPLFRNHEAVDFGEAGTRKLPHYLT